MIAGFSQVSRKFPAVSCSNHALWLYYKLPVEDLFLAYLIVYAALYIRQAP